MKHFGIILSIVLGCSLVGSLIFLVIVLTQRENQWQHVVSELILVVVLAAEGLFAIFHLAESRADRQAESLRDFMHDFAEVQALRDREDLAIEIPWGHDFAHIPHEHVEWTCKKTSNSVDYTMQENADCKIEITMKSGHWPKIQRLCDQYHFAGLACVRDYMDIKDVLNWMGPQPIRWWMRLGRIIEQERLRRRNPALFKGFENLATAARNFFPETRNNATRISMRSSRRDV